MVAMESRSPKNCLVDLPVKRILIDDASCPSAAKWYRPSMTVVTCKLPKKLAAKLERVAKDEHRSKQAVLREAIEQRLKTKRPVPRVSAYDLVKHIVGTLDGPSDLATNPERMKGFGE